MTDQAPNRTQEQAVADQIDCDLDNMVRRCLQQCGRAPEARQHWQEIAMGIETIRTKVRKRMHEEDRKATQ
jgi:hypothetical protein